MRRVPIGIATASTRCAMSTANKVTRQRSTIFSSSMKPKPANSASTSLATSVMSLVSTELTYHDGRVQLALMGHPRDQSRVRKRFDGLRRLPLARLDEQGAARG